MCLFVWEETFGLRFGLFFVVREQPRDCVCLLFRWELLKSHPSSLSLLLFFFKMESRAKCHMSRHEYKLDLEERRKEKKRKVGRKF